METKILNFDTISQGKLDAYVYVDGMYPTKGTIMGFMGFDDIIYTDTISIVIYASHTFHTVQVDVIQLVENNTDHLEFRHDNKKPTFITTSKATLMDYMRKEVLTSPHTWVGKLGINNFIQRKDVAKTLYHELVKVIKKL
jgi:hypothetical protein